MTVDSEALTRFAAAMPDPIPFPRHPAKRWHDRKDAGRKPSSLDIRHALVATTVVAGGLAGYALPGSELGSSLFASVNPACNIKGNVSFNGGRKIYHVPGQLDYSSTVINSRYGERWFCSEAEARAAGWRAATR